MKKFNSLKIITFYKNEKTLIKRAGAGNPEAQQLLYDCYAPKMLSVCRQYIRDVHYAEDVMIMGFVKVFKNLDQFRHEGCFEGWIRRIMIHEAISYLRKKQFVVYDEELFNNSTSIYVDSTADLEVEYIQKLIDELPEGYKLVFVLFAIEGFKHSEIAEMLQISESTSKSQLFKARKTLQDKINKLEMSERRKLRPS
ncbi:RNA polymerase sigma factor [Muriicola sp. Z0-33]|uniref:RNA polymerase sigma factor n=1 Tax=Muriicola sp. Z0-33 TaxID=2816957 RepID=UPI0039E033E2